MADAASIARALAECVNRHDVNGFRDLLHSDYTYTGPDGVTHHGPDAGAAQVEMFVTAFPDLVLEVTAIHDSGDVAAMEFRAKGTHLAELAGIPATGKTAEVFVCDVIGVRDGKVLFEREYFDQMSMMQQLGVIPS